MVKRKGGKKHQRISPRSGRSLEKMIRFKTEPIMAVSFMEEGNTEHRMV